MLTWIFVTGFLALAPTSPVDLSQFDSSCGIRIEKNQRSIRAEWTGPGQAAYAAVFSLENGQPLFQSLEANGTVVARGIAPVFTVTVGSRIERPNERYIFFDKPASRPSKTHDAVLDLQSVRVRSTGSRASILFSKLAAGPFVGDLVVQLYAGSPLIHVEAAMSIDQPRTAYIYDFTLQSDWTSAAWIDNQSDHWVRSAVDGDPRPVGVRHRTIFGETPSGNVAVFPPPHAFFFPRDYTINFKFAQVGKKRVGLRQDPAGGPGHQGAFIPWFDAPPGKTQRMSAFLLVSPGKPELAIDRIKAYTHNDRFKALDGRLTFTTHWHLRLTVNELAGKPVGHEVAKIFKAMNVNIAHLAEFHGDGDPFDPGPKRLPQLKAMFDVCKKYSDDQILFIPGEEANAHLNHDVPKGLHPGHWVYLFPKPVYLTLVRPDDAPFIDEIPPYGPVYRAGNEREMVEILQREDALAWTAHPRIKASFAAPDSYKHKDWYQSDLWLGAAWKAMPADLSEPRLGVRALDLLDDMNTWGQRKHMPGEVDTFELDATHELYAHMNINYLKLDVRPTSDDWSPVLRALRQGQFFTTTGEVLLHSVDLANGKLTADIEWTFPLAQILLVSWDGKQLNRRVIPVTDAKEFERRQFEWSIPPASRWVRLEAWDIATDGAFTQPLWQ